MRRNMGIANEKGLTLVEILAALVILGIVFVGFMTIFPQMTSFNEKTGTKLQAMNDARIILEEIKRNEPYSYNYFDSSKEYFDENPTFWRKSNDNLQIKVFKSPVLEPGGETDTEKNEQYFLHKIEVVVLENENEISKTFGLVQVRFN